MCGMAAWRCCCAGRCSGGEQPRIIAYKERKNMLTIKTGKACKPSRQAAGKERRRRWWWKRRRGRRRRKKKRRRRW